MEEGTDLRIHRYAHCDDDYRYDILDDDEYLAECTLALVAVAALDDFDWLKPE